MHDLIREGEFSDCTIVDRTGRNNATFIRLWTQWTQDNRTSRKCRSGRRNVMSANNVTYLIHIIGSDHTSRSGQLTECWRTATAVPLSSPNIRQRLLYCGLYEIISLNRILHKHKHWRFHLQYICRHGHWCADQRRSLKSVYIKAFL